MTSEVLHAQRRIAASAAELFGVLSDPGNHVDIDGTGWVAEPLDLARLTEVGQRFRMAMHHENHPDKDYEMTNEVVSLEAPHAIGWRPGQPDDNGEVQFGGWLWRYQLDAVDADSTDVTLTYDWSAATAEVRTFIDFPPFGPEHLDHSLAHLEQLTARKRE